MLLLRIDKDEEGLTLNEEETDLTNSLINLYSIFHDSLKDVQSMSEPTAHGLVFMKKEIIER